MANIKAVHWISQQLRVPRVEALPFLERYVGAKLVCVLGGEYAMVQAPSGLEYWESSGARIASETARPADYQAPILTWFRGLRLEGTIENSHVEAHGFIDLLRKESPKPTTPSIWDLLNGAPKSEAPEEIPPPLPTAPAEAVPPPPARRAF